MPTFDFDCLVETLQERYGEDLRWVANYDSKSYDYQIRHVRKDLKNELKGNQLDHVIHRSLAVYNKRHAEDVYFHLGEADHLAVEYAKGTAFHVFLTDTQGVTIMLEPDAPVTTPDDLNDWRDAL